MQYRILFVILFISTLLKSQSVVLKSVYSKELNDTIYYRVWLPENFDKTVKHTAIYTVEDTEDGIIFGCASFAMKQKNIPNTIVVGIIKGRMYIDFNFVTGKPNTKGEVFLKELTTQIIPDVEKEFGASVYKAFMGHSYSAVYGNYLMLYHPEIFKGYILFAPERYWNDETKPLYDISDDIKSFYNRNKSFVYLAVGENDIERRKSYVKEIAQKIKVIDSTSLFFNSAIVPGANHMTIVPQKMDEALWHIFSTANDYQQADSVANVLQYFNQVQQNTNEVFGIDIPRYPETSWYFYGLAAKNKDEQAFNTFINYFPFQTQPGGRGLDYCNIASICLANGWKEKAETLYKKAIEQSVTDEKMRPALQNLYNIEMATRNLAQKIYINDINKGWSTLENAVSITQNIGAYFNAGKFAVDKKINIKKGIEYLEKCLTMRDNEDFNGLQERIFEYLAEAYWLEKNKKKSIAFAKQTLTLNPNNEKAKKILSENSY